MSALAQTTEPLVSLQEYLAAEESSEIKHEYWAGRVFAMAGGTPRHADIIHNVSVAFGPHLRGHRCRGSSGEQRIRIEESDVEVYPDFVVKCPPEQYSALDPHALTNPALVVEVLSPGSEKDDRGEKFEQYSKIPELKDYLLVSQDKVLVEHFQRGEGDEWILRRYLHKEDVLPIPNLEIEVPIAEIYEGHDLPSGLTITRR
jgi:Uma2 family endonuclease